MIKIRRAWAFARKYWKALAGGLSVLLVLAYKLLSDRHRKRAIELKRKAHMAEGGKVEHIKDANEARHKAAQHGRKANEHQRKASEVIEKLRQKERKRHSMKYARELAERIAGEG